MSEDIDKIRQDRDRLQAERDALIASLTPHPLQNHRVGEAERVRAESEKSARVRAAMQAGLEREAAAIAEREAALVAAGQERLATYREETRQRFIHSGGSESDWRSAWPAMKSAWLIEQAATDPKERRIQEAAARLRTDPRYARL